MKKINITNKGIKIGELVFDTENKIADIQFNQQENKSYFDLIKLIMERISKRAYPDLIFNDKNGHIENVDENILLAMKQELFINFEWILRE